MHIIFLNLNVWYDTAPEFGRIVFDDLRYKSNFIVVLKNLQSKQNMSRTLVTGASATPAHSTVGLQKHHTGSCLQTGHTN